MARPDWIQALLPCRYRSGPIRANHHGYTKWYESIRLD